MVEQYIWNFLPLLCISRDPKRIEFQSILKVSNASDARCKFWIAKMNFKKFAESKSCKICECDNECKN
jgi:hypothetical protein